MKTDRIFVLLLVVILPMSGCFDDAVGDAEGADDTSAVVNNFYYNNTTTVVHETPEMIAIGGVIPAVGTTMDYISDMDVAIINTSAGQMIRYHEIHGDFEPMGYSSYLSVNTTCANGALWNNYAFSIQYGAAFYGPGAAFDCTHVITASASEWSAISWSVTYSVVPVTIG